MTPREVFINLTLEEARLVDECQDQFRLMVERQIQAMYEHVLATELEAADCPCDARPDDENAVGDNAVGELVDLARAGDRRGFDALASCLMPAGDVDACWAGTRKRLGVEP